MTLQKIRQQVESDFVQERLKQHFASDARLLGEELEKDRTTLKKVAEKMGLPLQTAKGLTAAAQQLPPEQAILTHANVKRALFAAQTLSSKQASDPITVSPNDLVVLRVTEHVPAHTTPYETIKAQVSADYVQSKAAELAQEAGKAQLQQWLQNPASASFAAPVLVSRVKPGAYSQAVVDAAMRADVSKLPALEGADLGPQGYAIVRVLKEAAEAEDVAAALRAQYAPAVQQSIAQAQVQAYLSSIKPLLNVKINVPKPEMPADLAQ
jgi:peptidyl-prolyl cis-trans isomerase D